MTKISSFLFFFFNATASTEIYTLSLHYALPIFASERLGNPDQVWACAILRLMHVLKRRSEEHTSELQSHSDVVCGLLLEKKKEAIGQHRRHLRKAGLEGEQFITVDAV